jgi:acyl dehydratase
VPPTARRRERTDVSTLTLDQLHGAVGSHLGYSDWHTITQEQINQFADATGDHQWIHIDPVRAADGPFGTTIAHGYLILSHIPLFLREAFEVSGLSMGINYGSNRVRYSAPVPVGSRLRGGVELIDLTQRPNGTMAVMRVTVERDGADKPACVAEVVSLLVP